MTQEGFRKFRRRAHRQSSGSEASPELTSPAEMEDDAGFQDDGLHKEQVLSLPTPLPPVWERLPRIAFDPDQPNQASLPMASASRDTPAARGFDLLRTRLLQALKLRGWSRVAVCAPTSGCGVTFTAINLALSLARVPSSRTILMDLNFRAPGLAAAMGVAGPIDMASFLAGETSLDKTLIRPLETLALGLNAGRDSNAAEILHDSRTAGVLDAMIEETNAETVLFDLPPLLEYDDAAAFLPQVDGVLLVSDGTQTTAAQLSACEGILGGHVPLLGVVLNRGRSVDGGAAVA